jgi:hypothetical protein
MNKTYTLHQDEYGQFLYRRMYLLIRKNWGAWQSTSATLGLLGGILSIILGMLLWLAVRFISPGEFRFALNVLSNVFFVVSLPLLLLGASSLDLLERKPPLLPPISDPSTQGSKSWRLKKI